MSAEYLEQHGMKENQLTSTKNFHTKGFNSNKSRPVQTKFPQLISPSKFHTKEFRAYFRAVNRKP